MSEERRRAKEATLAGTKLGSSEHLEMRAYCGGLAGIGVLLITDIAAIGHPLDRPLAFALYDLCVSVPLLSTAFAFTYPGNISAIPTWVRYLVFGAGAIGVLLAMGAFIWHVNYVAALLFGGVVVALFTTILVYVAVLVTREVLGQTSPVAPLHPTEETS